MANDNEPFDIDGLIRLAGAHLDAAMSSLIPEGIECNIDRASATLAQANILISFLDSRPERAGQSDGCRDAALAWLGEIERLKGSSVVLESMKVWMTETIDARAGK